MGKYAALVVLILLTWCGSGRADDECVVLDGKVYCPDQSGTGTLSQCTQVGPDIFCN